MKKLVTGLYYTDAIVWTDCPKCGALAGTRCTTPQGRTTPEPHIERRDAYITKYPDRDGLYTAAPGVNLRSRIHDYNAKLSQQEES